MEETFDPTTQYLEFKQTIIDESPIYVYQNWSFPSITIIPSETSEDMKLFYWNQGLTHLFDVINMTQSVI
jgi:hypothetical protein